MKVLTVFGTRPEAIKMCPLVLKLQENKDIESVVCLTGQHKEMLYQVMEAFGVKEDYNLEIMKDRQMHIATASEPFCGAKRPHSGLHRT